jgi:hypothetical protein
VLDRGKLERLGCGCHTVVAREAKRHWPRGAPHLDSTLGVDTQHYH